MEAVGARLGRSSTRYGPATVFSGPVRKWKKKWVHVSPSSSTNSNNNNNNNNASSHHSHNSSANAHNASHLSLYKWTPLSQSNNATNANAADNVDAPESDEPPRRKFKYVPIAVLEEHKIDGAENEDVDKVEDKAKLINADPSGGLDEKPDINDVPVEENQVVRQDLNESTLDLSLGLMAHDDEHESDSKIIK